MFKGKFVESKSLRVELNDVEPWVFKGFVGWLYTQRVYYDRGRVEPVQADGAEDGVEDEEMKEDQGVTEAADETSSEHAEYEGENEASKTNAEEAK